MKSLNKQVDKFLKFIKKNKTRISDFSIGWKNKDKEEPKVMTLSRSGIGKREKIEYLKIEIYLKYPLKNV